MSEGAECTIKQSPSEAVRGNQSVENTQVGVRDRCVSRQRACGISARVPECAVKTLAGPLGSTVGTQENR